jgi:hypothetical protein
MTVLKATLLLRTVSAFETTANLFGPSRARVLRDRFACPRTHTRMLASATETPKAADAEATEPIVLPTNENSEKLLKIRHSTSHIMAMAVQKLFKGTKGTLRASSTACQ